MRKWPKKSLSDSIHQPVMVKQVIESLSSCPDGIFVDATIGAGGHSREVIKIFGNKFEYIGFDLDSIVLKKAASRLAEYGPETKLIKSNFADIAVHLKSEKIPHISAALYDLGIGSFQIDDPERGFSYLNDGPLGMSFDDTRKYSASDLIANSSEKELFILFRTLGQERKAKSLAKAIKNYPERITTTGQLAQIIRSVAGDKYFIKTASRVFQAIRIEVNAEFENISRSLESVIPLLAVGGRALVITYHSLEDGLVKRIFKKYSGKCVCPPGMPECRCGAQKLIRLVFSKPVVPDSDEVNSNPRARSAKLRVVERIEAAA
ncbi:MAG: 16S rRNA (cytosine(1402)-N(4))-methyltransferase RsmH [candidate division Zixibacteria bacterium]|nr:16S rRNA (cytosine(1402)-N(4))-methyltransferase RsmH [candidate division Zixibacteria bacterium]